VKVQFDQSSSKIEDLVKIQVVLENMAACVKAEVQAMREGQPREELIVQVNAEAGQAWKDRAETWTVFEAEVKFSAGPNNVYTQATPGFSLEFESGPESGPESGLESWSKSGSEGAK